MEVGTKSRTESGVASEVEARWNRKPEWSKREALVFEAVWEAAYVAALDESEEARVDRADEAVWEAQYYVEEGNGMGSERRRKHLEWLKMLEEPDELEARITELEGEEWYARNGAAVEERFKSIGMEGLRVRLKERGEKKSSSLCACERCGSSRCTGSRTRKVLREKEWFLELVEGGQK
jgi:hypothetical protein